MPAARAFRTLLAATAMSAAILAAPAPAASQGSEAFDFMAIGDMPYGWPDGKPGFERLIATVNAARPAFTVHVGDFKKGAEPCTDEYFELISGYFATFESALVYTPGDNEWTDCHRKPAGSYDPVERLAKLRQMFHQGSRSLGKRPFEVVRQSRTRGFEKFVENMRFSRGPVTFATVHAVGSNNNLRTDPVAFEEHRDRTRAALAWLDETFQAARRDKSLGVVVMMQANPFFEKWSDERSGMDSITAALESKAKAFEGQTLLVHGDTHSFRIDKPLKSASGATFMRFTRLEVPAEQDMHPVRVRVDPADPDLFSFKVLQVPGNQQPY